MLKNSKSSGFILLIYEEVDWQMSPTTRLCLLGDKLVLRTVARCRRGSEKGIKKTSVLHIYFINKAFIQSDPIFPKTAEFFFSQNLLCSLVGIWQQWVILAYPPTSKDEGLGDICQSTSSYIYASFLES